MMIRRVAPLALLSTALVPAALLLAACSGTPTAPIAVPSTQPPAGPETCDASIFTDNVDADLTAETEPLDQLPFPLAGLADAGVPVTCTAHLTVDYADADQTVEFDIVLVNAPIADVTADLDDVTASEGWVRDDGKPIWREDGDQNHYVEALEIEEGVLVGVTQAG